MGLVKYRLMDFVKDLLMAFVDHRLMNLMDLFFNYHWLSSLLDHVLMVLMNYVFMVFVNDISMMLMYHVDMNLSDFRLNDLHLFPYNRCCRLLMHQNLLSLWSALRYLGVCCCGYYTLDQGCLDLVFWLLFREVFEYDVFRPSVRISLLQRALVYSCIIGNILSKAYSIYSPRLSH